ncbi:MAG: carbon-nitrogen hydrolase family protein [Proteobacteria bacterium]|nr:carbon-nitrogen hydrolase family protein [Pseudomonadota bacterium]
MTNDQTTRIALVQQHASHDKRDNLARGLTALREAAANGAQLIAYAELSFERFYPQRPARGRVADLAEPIPGPVTEALCAAARELGVVVVPNLFELDGEQTFDTSPVIDADGSLIGRTRMVHITNYEHFHETDYYWPSDRGAPVYQTAVGTIGVAICYDRHFPEYMRALALGGAQLVLVPQAGVVDEWPDELYQAEMRVTAFQNGYFIALCNRVGREEHLDFAGESFVCAPDGTVLASAAQGSDEILYAELDFTQVSRSVARRLYLRDRRPELYSDWLT